MSINDIYLVISCLLEMEDIPLLALPESPQLIALDLDGTLLNSNHSVSFRNKQILTQVSEQGIYVVLVSGRMHRSILPISNQIGLENPIVSYNGGMVKHATTGKIYNHTPVPAKFARKIIDLVNQENLHLNFCLNDELYVREKNKWSDLYEFRTGISATAVGNLLSLAGEEPTKVQILDEPEKIDQLFPILQETFGHDLYVTKTQIEYIEFMNLQSTKGRALKALAAQLKIPISNTVAFGDGYNDKSMMETVGFSIAMANAVDEIKAIADYVTTSNDDDGIAVAVEKLLL